MVTYSKNESFSDLRKRAQRFLTEKSQATELDHEAIQRLVHELDTYHVELELQNEDLRNLQQELEKSRSRYATLYEFAPIAYMTVSDKGMILEANLTSGKLLGVLRSELLNRPFTDFIFVDDQDIFYLHRKQLVESRQQQSYELRLKKKDGSLLHGLVETIVQPESWDSPEQFLIMVSDISRRKEAELEKIRELKNRYRAIVMDQSELICRFTPDHKLTFVNDAYCRFFGIKFNEVLNTTFKPDIHKDDILLVRDQFKQFPPLEPTRTIEYRVHTPGGQLAWLQCCCRALADEHGNIYKYQTVARDITQLKKTEAALRQAHDELEQRVQKRTVELQQSHKQLLHSEKLGAIGNLSASIAHEFNNPLQSVMTVIKGIGQYVPMEKKEGELLDLALQECQRMKRLIADLRDFSRLSSDQMTEVDLHAILDGLLLLTKKDFSGRKIQIVVKYSDTLSPIMAVADQMKQVFLNLLNNAADACKSGGVITVTTETVEEKEVIVHIEDNGIGMPPHILGKIFEPFFTTKPEVKGTGLGLSVSYGIVKKHGGSIDVQSEVGKGSKFSVILPIDGAHNERQINFIG